MLKNLTVTKTDKGITTKMKNKKSPKKKDKKKNKVIKHAVHKVMKKKWDGGPHTLLTSRPGRTK